MTNLTSLYTSRVIFLNLDFDSLIINVIDGYTSEIILIVIIFPLLLISITVVLLLISRREVR
jgi:hypothetical protein